jgi:formylglycine-generating enzyme required for sulfatase activity
MRSRTIASSFTTGLRGKLSRFARMRGEHPVVGVTAFEAARYAAFVGKRLPTEEEWERATRGTDGRSYPWGDEPRQPGFWSEIPVGTRAVDQLSAAKSPYEVRDIGQVWEWTSSHDEARDAPIVRGGPWRDDPTCPAVTNRSWQTGARKDTGFRCARDVLAEDTIRDIEPPFAPRDSSEEITEIMKRSP